MVAFTTVKYFFVINIKNLQKGVAISKKTSYNADMRQFYIWRIDMKVNLFKKTVGLFLAMAVMLSAVPIVRLLPK